MPLFALGYVRAVLIPDDGGMGNRDRRGYPSDVTDEEWSFVSPYLALCREDARQREYPLRTVFKALRYMAKTGCHWRMLPNDLPPWPVVYQQMRRWIDARCFETMVEDLRILLRAGRKGQPTAVVLDSRTLQSTPESGARAGYDGAKRRKGSKVHAAVDTLGHLLALHVTGADAQDRTQVAALAEAVQEITGEHVELAYFVVCRDFRQARDVGIQPAAGLFRWRRCAAESSRTPLWIDRQYV